MEFTTLLWIVFDNGFKGCRSSVFPESARLQPWKIGSFSISRTSIFLVRLAKFKELKAVRFNMVSVFRFQSQDRRLRKKAWT